MNADAVRAAADEERRQLRRLRVAAVVEGATLVLLVALAVPLKHLFGMPVATRIMGPIHGVAFMLYVWTLVVTVSGGGWRTREIARLALAAFVPFGALLNRRMLRDKELFLAGAG